jgi:hypothetical protein
LTNRELIERLLFLAQTAVDQALDLNYDDPEDYFITRELRELKAAALAQPEPQVPTDDELLELMPETMRDEFSYAAKVCSDATGGQVKPGIFRVALNTAALEYARAVLEAANSKPTPNPSQIRTSLVERVVMAIGRDGETARWSEARTAIREVAAWLREQHDGDLVAATVLEQEAGR